MKHLLTPIILALALLFAGCETTGLNGSQKRIARIAVTYATMKAIDGQADKAQRALAIVSTARAALGGETATTVAALIEIARNEINWQKLDQADAMLVELVLAEVRIELENRLGPDLLGEERALVVSEVLGWVEYAAKTVVKAGSEE